MKLIAETDLKCKQARFYRDGGHLAECYPENSPNSMKTNVYRYLSGAIKSFNKKHYFWFDSTGIPFTAEHLRKLELEALGVARAQIREMEIKKNQK